MALMLPTHSPKVGTSSGGLEVSVCHRSHTALGVPAAVCGYTRLCSLSELSAEWKITFDLIKPVEIRAVVHFCQCAHTGPPGWERETATVVKGSQGNTSAPTLVGRLVIERQWPAILISLITADASMRQIGRFSCGKY